jgi:hypothetical protein
VKSRLASARARRPVLPSLAASSLLIAAGWAASSPASASSGTFLSSLGPAQQVASTVPGNGDVNPYGVAVVPATVGRLVKGDVLVSNFNDKAKVQGTGTTIVEVSPAGTKTTFTQLGALPPPLGCPGGVGLTTALAALPGGWVVVGSLPAAASGTLPNVNPAGCVIGLNDAGRPAKTWSNQDINGPWDMTASTTGSGVDLFVSNALSRPAGLQGTPQSGTCSVVRLDLSISARKLPRLASTTVIANGLFWQANKAAFVLAPTGLALSPSGTLYVAETPKNHVTAIPDALTRAQPVKDGTSTLSSGGALNAPLGMAVAPNGDLIVVNGNDGDAVEVSPEGKQVATRELINNGAGDLFGVTLAAGGQELLFVDDGTNALEVAHAM